MVTPPVAPTPEPPPESPPPTTDSTKPPVAGLPSSQSTPPPPPAGEPDAPPTAQEPPADAAATESPDEDALDPALKVHKSPLLAAPLLRNTAAFFTSMVVHLALFIALGIWVLPQPRSNMLPPVVIASMPRPEVDLSTMELDQQFYIGTAVTFTPVAGTLSPGAAVGALASVSAPTLDRSVDDTGNEVAVVSVEAPDIIRVDRRQMIEDVPDGAIGDPRAIVDSYEAAMDRITQEILWLLAKQNVLLIWCFDQSESMKDDQKEIRDRIDRVYAELGLTDLAAGKALKTAVTSYGGGFAIHTGKPTSRLSEILAAIDSVPIDHSGKEIMCQAVMRSIAAHREMAGRERRKMALVLVTDESGDATDNNRFLEAAIAEANAANCVTYVLGREAVFGYPFAHMRWRHPQTGWWHWLPVDRGPETPFVEQLQTNGFHRRHDSHSAGFGPYEQTRLARQTGGIFFMLPTIEKALVHGKKRRYELEAMRRYRPDWRSRLEYARDRQNSHLQSVIWKVINDLNPYDPEQAKVIAMRVHFSPQTDQFLRQVAIEQAKAKIYVTYLDAAQRALEEIKPLREREYLPRWRANYDILYAQLLAYKVRIYEYGAYLDFFVRNPKTAPAMRPPNLQLIYWDIRTRKETITGELTASTIAQAQELFRQIIVEHADTPWAARAQWELDRGFGVELFPWYRAPAWHFTGPKIPLPKL